MQFNEVTHPIWIGLRVITQSPANCLIDKKTPDYQDYFQ